MHADCYAGAWTTWAASGPLLGGRDIEQSVRALMALVGVRTDLRWLNAAIHGTAEERLNAFLQGREGSLSADRVSWSASSYVIWIPGKSL